MIRRWSQIEKNGQESRPASERRKCSESSERRSDSTQDCTCERLMGLHHHAANIFTRNGLQMFGQGRNKIF